MEASLHVFGSCGGCVDPDLLPSDLYLDLVLDLDYFLFLDLRSNLDLFLHLLFLVHVDPDPHDLHDRVLGRIRPLLFGDPEGDPTRTRGKLHHTLLAPKVLLALLLLLLAQMTGECLYKPGPPSYRFY